MKRLSLLHEEFIDKARRPMTFGNLPVLPQEKDVPVVPVNRWIKSDSPVCLRKTYQFMTQDMRNSFVNELLIYEDKVQHNATITISEGEVTLEIRTKDVDLVTELDKEYAKHADELFKDVVYSLSDARNQF